MMGSSRFNNSSSVQNYDVWIQTGSFDTLLTHCTNQNISSGAMIWIQILNRLLLL